MHTAIHTHQTLRESVKANREAVRRRDEPSSTLVDSLAAPLYAKSPWELRLQLGELLIHQQDIRRPLGLPREIPADRLVAVLRTCLGRVDGLIIGVKARTRAAGSRSSPPTSTGRGARAPRCAGRQRRSSWRWRGAPHAVGELTGAGAHARGARALTSST